MKAQNLNVSINLSALTHQVMTTKKGTMGMFIPFELNDLKPYEKEGNAKGNVYLNLVAWGAKDESGIDDYGNSHSIKQSFSKELSEKMTKEEKYAKPYLGNAKPFSVGGGSSEVNNAAVEGVVGEDDLPF